ncbi:MAG: glycosyl hydrolase 2 galactose-binding domain-containing protein, partial [Bacteroidota bacterium]
MYGLRKSFLRRHSALAIALCALFMGQCWRIDARPLPLGEVQRWDLRQMPVQWSLRAQGWEQWLPLSSSQSSTKGGMEMTVAGPSGSVIMDLFQQGKIPHPYWGRNADSLGWVSDCTWVYKAEFHASNLMGDSRYLPYEPSCQLLVNGLDTYASVFLNGEPLGNF